MRKKAEASVVQQKQLELLLQCKVTAQIAREEEAWRASFYCYILYLLFDVRILNVALYVSRHGMYACVHVWAVCIRPRGV